jgi:hypothetical protein
MTLHRSTWDFGSADDATLLGRAVPKTLNSTATTLAVTARRAPFLMGAPIASLHKAAYAGNRFAVRRLALLQ